MPSRDITLDTAVQEWMEDLGFDLMGGMYEARRIPNSTMRLTVDIAAFFYQACRTREAAALKAPNDLLRSAYQIAQRQGQEVNWEAFTEQLRLELAREHQIMYGGGKHEANS